MSAYGWVASAPNNLCGSKLPRTMVSHHKLLILFDRARRTRDEGRSFEAGSQVLASNRCKLLSSKAMVSVAVNVGMISRRGEVERGERKRTANELSKAV